MGLGLSKIDAIPVGLIAAIATTALIWNLWVGFSWTPNLAMILAAPALFLALWCFYRRYRPRQVKIAEILFYVALWMVYPFFGVRLTYLAEALNLPAQDRLFVAIDAAMGFDWPTWAHFVSARPFLANLHTLAYESHFWQTFLTIPILAFLAPRGRNAELLTAILLALVITITIAGMLPALGPATANGFPVPWEALVAEIRAGQKGPFHYEGIIWFPSFHTVIAILLVIAHRGIRWTFLPVAVFNAIMLTSIPFTGGHYLIDVVGGLIVAFVAQYAGQRLIRRVKYEAPQQIIEIGADGVDIALR